METKFITRDFKVVLKTTSLLPPLFYRQNYLESVVLSQIEGSVYGSIVYFPTSHVYIPHLSPLSLSSVLIE